MMVCSFIMAQNYKDWLMEKKSNGIKCSSLIRYHK